MFAQPIRTVAIGTLRHPTVSGQAGSACSGVLPGVCHCVTVTDWVIDLDGVMWRGRVPIPGSADAIATLLARGDRVLFCTNNSAESGDARAQRLLEQGIPAGCEVVTSADAVCAMVDAGEAVAVLGGKGLVAALQAHGARPVPVAHVQPVDVHDFDAVAVGLTRDFQYRDLDVAAAVVRAGARLLASNSDSTFPGSDGLHPGCGSIVAAVETASGAVAAVAGKPWPPMAEIIRSRLALSESTVGEVVVVGDRPETDGRLAVALGARFAVGSVGGHRSRGPARARP